MPLASFFEKLGQPWSTWTSCWPNLRLLSFNKAVGSMETQRHLRSPEGLTGLRGPRHSTLHRIRAPRGLTVPGTNRTCRRFRIHLVPMVHSPGVIHNVPFIWIYPPIKKILIIFGAQWGPLGPPWGPRAFKWGGRVGGSETISCGSKTAFENCFAHRS